MNVNECQARRERVRDRHVSEENVFIFLRFFFFRNISQSEIANLANCQRKTSVKAKHFHLHIY